MLGFLKNILGGNSERLSEMINDETFLVDVRSKNEFASGSVKGAVNIPLDQLSNQLSKFKNKKNIVVFCASGMRSASAKNVLNRNGFDQVTNGGGWRSVQAAVEKAEQ